MTEFNLAGILAATFAGMVLGALWYSPMLFGNAWMRCIDKTPDTLGSQTGPLIGSLFASLLTATGVSILFSALAVTELLQALGMGATLGILIIFPALLSDNLFCGWGIKLLLIQAAYRVLTVILMSIVLWYV